MNERIRAREVRLIGDTGEQIGVVLPQEALKLAREKGLDLVEISPTANPPVCKIMDYGKYLYELNKKLHAARRHQKTIHLKEVKFRPRTDEHDYQVKRNHVLRFLREGDKVKATMIFRGREMAHPEFGRKMLKRLIGEIAEVGTVEMSPYMEGRALIAILAPKPGARPAPSRATARESQAEEDSHA